MWMFDTNICINLIRRKSEDLFERVREMDISRISLSAITVAELNFGAAKSSRPEHNRVALAAFLAPLVVEPFEDEAAVAYGTVRADLERVGTPIGAMDLLIGAHALVLGRTLVTHNEREFERIRGLRVENWITR